MTDDLTFGQRLRHHRGGMSRAVLGGLIGRSARWVKSVELGERYRDHPPGMSLLLRIAEVLNVKDLSDLVGDLSVPVQVYTGPGHPTLPAVRDALDFYTLTTDQAPQSLPYLEARLAAMWRTRLAATAPRTAVGELLPVLIRDAQIAAQVYQGGERRRAQSVLARTLNLTQMYLGYQPVPELVWRVTQWALVTAQESGDPRALCSSVWFAVQCHRDAGNWDAARSLNVDAIRATETHLPNGDIDLLALWGSLHEELALTAARAGETGTAWRHWDDAEQVTRRLPEGYVEYATGFAAPMVGVYATELAVELRRGGEAMQMARGVDLARIPPPRRGWHLVDLGRAHHLRGDQQAALDALSQAVAASPESLRYNPIGRSVLTELQQGSVRQQARRLAEKIGLPSV